MEETSDIAGKGDGQPAEKRIKLNQNGSGNYIWKKTIDLVISLGLKSSLFVLSLDYLSPRLLLLFKTNKILKIKYFILSKTKTTTYSGSEWNRRKRKLNKQKSKIIIFLQFLAINMLWTTHCAQDGRIFEDDLNGLGQEQEKESGRGLKTLKMGAGWSGRGLTGGLCKLNVELCTTVVDGAAAYLKILPWNRRMKISQIINFSGSSLRKSSFCTEICPHLIEFLALEITLPEEVLVDELLVRVVRHVQLLPRVRLVVHLENY